MVSTCKIIEIKLKRSHSMAELWWCWLEKASHLSTPLKSQPVCDHFNFSLRSSKEQREMRDVQSVCQCTNLTLKVLINWVSGILKRCKSLSNYMCINLYFYMFCFSSDINKRNWEQENIQEYQDSTVQPALSHVTWGICETESDFIYGEVENRLDLLQEQLNR